MSVRDNVGPFPNAAANAFSLPWLLKVTLSEQDTMVSVLAFVQCVSNQGVSYK